MCVYVHAQKSTFANKKALLRMGEEVVRLDGRAQVLLRVARRGRKDAVRTFV